MAIYVKNSSGTYVQVSSTNFNVKPDFPGFNPDYANVEAGYVKNASGQYVQFYQGASERTYTFYATGTATVWGTQFDRTFLRIGLINETGFPKFGLVYFDKDTQSTSLSFLLTVRPVVKSATIYMNRISGNPETNVNAYGNIYVGRYSTSVFSSSHSSLFTDYASEAVAASSINLPLTTNPPSFATLSLGASSIASNLVYHLASGKPLFFTSSSTSGALNTSYSTPQTDYASFTSIPYNASIPESGTAQLDVTLAYA